MENRERERGRGRVGSKRERERGRVGSKRERERGRVGSKRERERASVMCTQVSVGEFMYSMSTFMIICCDLQQREEMVSVCSVS